MFVRLFVCAVLSMLVSKCLGHGRLMEPPSRSSMWRKGFNTPANYDDNQLFCGGFNTQWNVNNGKCGVCGDDFSLPQPRPNEATGKYGNGIITRTYKQEEIITAKVEITAHHKGWMEFRLCPNNNVTKIVTQDCLDEYLLEIVNNSETRLNLTSEYNYTIGLQLPSDLTCTQCVLQWKYHTGNNWGCDTDGDCCVGCGPQEEFYGCSDVAISADGSVTLPPTEVPTIAITEATTTTSTTQIPTETTEVSTTADGPETTTEGEDDCGPVGVWKTLPGMATWCENNCFHGYCPASHCNDDCRRKYSADK